MSIKKRQHFVPQFYLRNFSPSYKRQQIGVFNITSQIYAKYASLREQACSNYFYGQDGKIENELSKIENNAAVIINKIINNNNNIPKPLTDEYLILLKFIFILRARTESASNELIEFQSKLFKNLYPNDVIHLKLLKSLLLKAPKQSIEATECCLYLLRDLSFKLLKNDTLTEFITSDNPVISYNQFMELKKARFSSTGLACKGLQVFVPISPRYLLVYYDPRIYKIGSMKQKIIEMKNPDDVAELNKLQVILARENLYFNNSDESELNKLLDKVMKFRNTRDSEIKEYYNQNKSMSKFISCSQPELKCNFQLSIIKILKKTKLFLLGNKAVHVRDENLCRKYDDFNNLVKLGKYGKYEFEKYISDQNRNDRTNPTIYQ